MIAKLFRKMLPSQIFSNLAMTLCLQIDVILIAQFFGVNGVASYGLVNPPVLLFTALTGLVSSGITTVCSGLVGRGDSKGINCQFSSAVALSFLIGFGFTAAILVFREPITAFLGAPAGSELHDSTLGYLIGYSLGLPFYLMVSSLTSYLHIAGKRQRVILSIVVMTVIDIALDVVNEAVFSLGMFGMGLATTISEVGAFLVVFGYFLSKKSMYRFSFASIRLKSCFQTFTAGLPIALNQTCFTISMFTVNRLLLLYGGNEALAAFSVIGALSNIGFAVSFGVGCTVQILSGIFYGEEDRDGVITSIKQGIFWTLLLNSILVVLSLIFARPFSSLYITDNDTALNLAISAVFISAYMIIPMGINVLFKNYYTVIKKLYLSLIVSLFENLIFMIPSYLLLSKLFGLNGLWAGRFLTEMLAMIIIYIIAVIAAKKPGFSIRYLSLIDTDFPVADNQTASFEICDKEGVSNSSQAACEFVNAATGDRSFSNYVGLCIEEIAAFTIERSFTDNKPHKISVRLVNRGDEWIIRMRDDCRQFDTAEYMKLHQSDDLISHLGIRMVFRLVTEAKYISSLGMNCLTMKLKYTKKA